MFNRRSSTDAADDTTTPDAVSPDATAAPAPTPAPDDSVVAPPVAPTAPSATAPDATPERAPVDRRQKGLTEKGKVRTTRVSALWVGLVTAAVLAIFLLIFIAQNSAKVDIRFLGFEGQVSLAIALLLAAVIGILVVAVPGSLRIGQLRRALRKNAKH